MKPIYYDIYDDVTNKTLSIKAHDFEEAVGISETLDFNNFKDGDEVDSIDNIIKNM